MKMQLVFPIKVKRIAILLLVAAFVLCSAGTVLAANYVWNGNGGDSNWDNIANWEMENGQPATNYPRTALDWVTIPVIDNGNYPVYDMTISVMGFYNDLLVGGFPGSLCYVLIVEGELTTAPGKRIIAYQGAYIQIDGTVTTESINVMELPGVSNANRVTLDFGPNSMVNGSVYAASGKITGDISATEHVQVGGGEEGGLAAVRDPNITSIEGDSVAVKCAVNGDIFAADEVFLGDKAEVAGDITAYKVMASDGAIVGGVITASVFEGDESFFNILSPSVGVVPSASVKKISGNQNELTITVDELYSDGSAKIVATTILKINNNAAGTYMVGDYKVYVDTKGNDQIRACYIVD